MDAKQRIEDYIPKLVAYKLLQPEEGRILLKNPAAFTYIFLGKEEKQWLEWMDGRTSVRDILQKSLNRTGTFSFTHLYHFLQKLNEEHFLEGEAAQKVLPPLPKGKRFFLDFFLPLSFLLRLSSLYKIVALPFSKKAFTFCLFTAVTLLAFFVPLQKDADIFQLQGSYVEGIGFLFLFLIGIESFRNVVRTGLLLRFHAQPYRFGLRLLGLFPSLSVDTRDRVTLPRQTQAIFHAGSLASLATVTLLLQLAQLLTGGKVPFLSNALFASLAWLFLSLCPFLPTDLFHFIEVFFPATQLFLHSRSYIQKKFFKQMFSRGEVTEEEKFFILLGSLGFIWIFAGAVLYLGWPAWEIFVISQAFSGATQPNKIAILFLMLFFVLPPLYFLGSLMYSITSNILSAFTPKRSKGVHGKKKGWQPTAQEIAVFLARIPLFYDLDTQELEKLSESVQPLVFTKGRKIIQQGDKGSTFYVLNEGEVEVVFEALSGIETPLAKLSGGDSFGEIALLEEVPRTATVRALGDVKLLALQKREFDQYLVKTPEKKESLTSLIRLFGQLHKMPFFADLDQAQVARLIRKLQRKDVRSGEVVIQEGDEGDYFYIIAEGTFSVWAGKEKKAVLHKGDSFGEIALIKRIPRTATVKADSAGTLYMLSSEEFYAVMGESLYAGMYFEEMADKRLEKLKP